MRAKKRETWNEPTVRLEIIPPQKPQKASIASPKRSNSEKQGVWNQPTVLLDLVPSYTQRQEVWNQPTLWLEPVALAKTQGLRGDSALLQQEPILFVARRPWLRRCLFLGAVFLLSALLLWLQSAFYGISPQAPDWHAGIQWREFIWVVPVLVMSVLCLGWIFFAEREKKPGDNIREIMQLLGYTFSTGAVVTLSMIIPLMILLSPVLPHGWNRLLIALGILALGELVVCTILMKTTPRLKGQLLRSEDMETVRKPMAFDVAIGTTYRGNEVRDLPCYGKAISTPLTGMLVLADMPPELCKTQPLF
ncbi:MAG TPA: hypothetical protein DCL75_14725 [Ktedonobacter sp.]|nr:hypothetical protein [Ktedonobacter sp.]